MQEAAVPNENRRCKNRFSWLKHIPEFIYRHGSIDFVAAILDNHVLCTTSSIVVFALAEEFAALEPLGVFRGPEDVFHHLLRGDVAGRGQQVDALFLGVVAQVVVPEGSFEHLEHVQLGVFAEHDVGQGVAELGDIASFFEVLADEDFGLEDLLEISQFAEALKHGLAGGEVLVELLSVPWDAGGGHVEPAQVGEENRAVENGAQQLLAGGVVEGAVECVGVGIDVGHVVPVALVFEVEAQGAQRAGMGHGAAKLGRRNASAQGLFDAGEDGFKVVAEHDLGELGDVDGRFVALIVFPDIV